MVQAVQYPALEQLLVADPDLDWIALGAVLLEPGGNQRHIASSPGAACALIERLWCPVQVDAVGSVLSVKWLLAEHRLDALGHGKR